ncbi:MAG: magnesium transporter [Clostridiales bacterium]|nr:magnesium transporter [Clostridiales bacterium]
MNEEEKNLIEEEQIYVPEKRDYEQEILEFFSSNLSLKNLREKLSDYHENDIASILPRLTKEQRSHLYKALGVDRVSDVFAYLDEVEEYIEELDSEKAADIIESMDADDAVDVLDELEEEKKEEIINLMEKESVADIQLIDSYGEDEIGSKMTTNYISFKKTFTVKQAMRAVIKEAEENDNITTLYALNEDDTFYGAIQLKDLIRARDTTPLDDIITTSYPYVYAKESVSACLEQLKDYSEDSIPVLNKDNLLIGVITSNDIVEVVDEELGEDYAKLAGLTEEEDVNEPVFKSIKKRIPWLLILLALGLVVSSVITKFQENIPMGLLILYSFQSLILGMSGNTGTQSLGVTIRVLGDEDFKGKDKIKFILKELRVGLLNGLIIGIISFVFIGLYVTYLTDYPKDYGIPLYGFEISACIGFSLVATTVMASLIGTLIPMGFKKIGIDPAVASGPLITTVNDLISVFTYYGLSLLLFVQIGLFSYPL